MEAIARPAPRSRFLWPALAFALAASILLHGLSHSGPSSPAAASARAAGHAGGGLALLAPSARGAVSGTLGAQLPAYSLAAGAGGALLARNPGQRLSASFGASGAALTSGPLHVVLSPARVGPVSLGGPAAAVATNRAGYSRGPVREWFVNGPAGIEQGFTIGRALTSKHLTITQPVSGSARTVLSPDGRSVSFRGPGASALDYTGLGASDASGRALPVTLSLHGTAIAIGIDVRRARYPITVDPLIEQGPKLTAPKGEENTGGAFGVSVALSADGRTALVGAFGVIVNKVEVGAAWVFTRTGSTWQQQGPRLTASDESGPGLFGTNVALSADGNIALIGGPEDGEHGAAWVFTRSGSAWSQQGPKLTAAAGEASSGSGIGQSVAISADGSTALLGGPGDGGDTGAAWVFTHSGAGWSQQGAKIVGGEESGTGQFGWSAALAGDGNTAVLGGFSDAGDVGAAWAFTRAGATWAQQGKKLTGGGETGAGQFGVSVALAGGGSTAIVGAPHDNSQAGAAWVFTHSGAGWSQQGQKLTGGIEETGPGQFGQSAALSADGSTALIGAYFDNENVGAAYEFVRRGATWAAIGGKKTGEGLVGKAEYGIGVALSPDGDTAMVGGEGDNGFGAAWAYADPPPGATTGVATGVGQSTATLTGSGAPGASYSARFQYGTSTAYGAATAPVSVANSFPPPGASAASTLLSAGVGGLQPSTTYHYRLALENSAGASFGADQVLQTSAAPPSAPRLTGLAQSHPTWRAGRRAAALASKRPPVGTTFRFSLDQNARVTLTFTQSAKGRRSGRRCVAQTRRNRHAHRCTRTITKGALTFAAHAGTDRIAFQGALTRTRRLAPGRYSVILSAVNGAGLKSAAASLSFRIVR